MQEDNKYYVCIKSQRGLKSSAPVFYFDFLILKKILFYFNFIFIFSPEYFSVHILLNASIDLYAYPVSHLMFQES